MAQLPDKAKRSVDAKNVRCTATIMPDGSPQVAPVWLEREGDTVRVNTTVGRGRYKNLKRDPRVALWVFDLADSYAKV